MNINNVIPPQNKQYKIIVAIKCTKDSNKQQSYQVQCSIQIQDKIKTSQIPFTQGQFFEFDHIDCNQSILITFNSILTDKLIGTTYVKIPEIVKEAKEVELTDFFNFTVDEQGNIIRGNYYIIVINKQSFLDQIFNEEQQSESLNKNLSGSTKPTTKQQINQKNINQKQNKQKLEKKQKKQTEADRKFHTESKKLQEIVNQTLKNAQDQIEESKKTDISMGEAQNSSSANSTQQILTMENENDYRIKNSLNNISNSFQQNDDINEYSSIPANKNVISSSCQSSHSPSKDGFIFQNHQNNACLYYIDSANHSQQLKNTVENLKKIIHIQQTKLESHQNLQKIYASSEKKNIQNEEKIKEYCAILKQAQDEAFQYQNQAKKQNDDVLTENLDLKKQIRGKNELINDALLKNNQFNTQLQKAQIEIQEKDYKLQESELNKTKLAQQQLKNKDLYDQISNNNKIFEKKIQEFQATLISYSTVNENQKVSIQQIEQEKYLLKTELNNLNLKMKEQAHILKTNDRDIKIRKTQDDIVKTLNSQINIFQQEILEIKRQNKLIQENLKIEKQENEKLKADNLNDNQQANQKYIVYRQSIQDHKNLIDDLQKKIDLKNREITQQKDSQSSLKLKGYYEKDIQLQINEYKQKLESFEKINQADQVRESIFQESLKQASQNLLESRQQTDQYRQKLKESQSYCAQLKSLILDLKETGSAYIPFYEDPIDKALAEFVNTLNDPSCVINLFIRESEGYYLFGTKKIYIKSKIFQIIQYKVEQGRILIRIGGGFVGIEEFLDLYGPSETEKMKETTPIKDYDKNRVVQQAIDKAKVIKQTRNQQSPLKYRQSRN